MFDDIFSRLAVLTTRLYLGLGELPIKTRDVNARCYVATKYWMKELILLLGGVGNPLQSGCRISKDTRVNFHL